ncbi:MAG TPA: arylamine N-acetyltransferase [Opitutaceae bacterium]|nr:arylamine N-acetyltransferase [Opitutaceae bacterium]
MPPYYPRLDAYFDRIGYTGSREPTVDTLHQLSLAHVTSVPFENLDILLGRGVDLDPQVIERKIIDGRRGGYCFEQNGLFYHVLVALGYQVSLVSARVRWQRPREFIPPRAHLFLRVEIDGQSWLVDAGIGGLSLTSALPLDDTGREYSTAHEPRRIIREDGKLFHQVRIGNEWQDLCEFTLEEMPPIDREVANWYTSAHPASGFRSRLFVARATPDGRATILNNEFTRRDRSGRAETQIVTDSEELLAILAQHFGLRFPSGTRFRVHGSALPLFN